MKKILVCLLLLSCMSMQLRAQDSTATPRYQKGTAEYYRWKKKSNLITGIVLYAVGGTCASISLMHALGDSGSLLVSNSSKNSEAIDPLAVVAGVFVAASVPFFVGYFRNHAKLKALYKQQQVSITTPLVKINQLAVGVKLVL